MTNYYVEETSYFKIPRAVPWHAGSRNIILPSLGGCPQLIDINFIISVRAEGNTLLESAPSENNIFFKSNCSEGLRANSKWPSRENDKVLSYWWDIKKSNYVNNIRIFIYAYHLVYEKKYFLIVYWNEWVSINEGYRAAM